MGLLDAALKLLVRAGPAELLGLVPGVPADRAWRLLDKEFTPPPPLPRALDGCLEVTGEEGGTVYHLEFEAEPRSDTGLRVFRHCALAHLGLEGRPIRPIVYYLTPGREGRAPQDRYAWTADGKTVLELRFEITCLWERQPADLLARRAPALWALVPLCAGATLADVAQAWRQTATEVVDRARRADIAAVTYALAGRRFKVHDLLQVLPREVLMESREYYQDLFPEAFQQGLSEGENRGEARGRAEGETRGRAAGLALALLSVLSARDLAVSDAERQRILACAEPATLERWVRRAATATTTANALD